MPNIKNWEFEEFPYGDIYSQRIDFSIDDHHFFMIFTPVITDDDDYIQDRQSEVEFCIPDRSYDVKFDRVENFENGDFYVPPGQEFSFMGPGKMRRLGSAVCQLIDFHCSVTGAQAYFASAENLGLKQFYDRLANNYASELNYEVTTGLGEEGLDYAIKTSKFKQ